MKKQWLAVVTGAVIFIGGCSAATEEKTEEPKQEMMEKEEAMPKEETKKEEATNKFEEMDQVKNKGDMLPMMTLKDVNGTDVSLQDYKGKKIYVKYWASWCPICMGGMEELNELSGANNDFELITIVTPSYKGEKATGDFKKWWGEQPYKNITVWVDEDGQLAKKLDVRGYPTSLYVGSDSVVVKRALGHIDNETIRDSVKGFQ